MPKLTTPRKGIFERAEELWAASEVGLPGTQAALSACVDAQRDAAKTCLKSYYALTAGAVALWLLDRRLITTIPFLGINVNELSSLLAGVLVFTAFAYYQATCAFVVEQYLQRMLLAYYTTHFPAFNKSGLDKLLFAPSFVNIERFLSRSMDSIVARLSGLAMFLLLLLAPAAFLAWACVRLAVITPESTPALAVVCILAATVLAGRTLHMIMSLLTQPY